MWMPVIYLVLCSTLLACSIVGYHAFVDWRETVKRMQVRERIKDRVAAGEHPLMASAIENAPDLFARARAAEKVRQSTTCQECGCLCSTDCAECLNEHRSRTRLCCNCGDVHVSKHD